MTGMQLPKRPAKTNKLPNARPIKINELNKPPQLRLNDVPLQKHYSINHLNRNGANQTAVKVSNQFVYRIIKIISANFIDEFLSMIFESIGVLIYPGTNNKKILRN